MGRKNYSHYNSHTSLSTARARAVIDTLSDPPPGYDWLFSFGHEGFLPMAVGARGARFFFHRLPSHLLLSGHSDNFSKCDKVIFIRITYCNFKTFLCEQ